MKKIWSFSREANHIENIVAKENPLQDPVELVSQCCGDEVEEAGERYICLNCGKECGVSERRAGGSGCYI